MKPITYISLFILFGCQGIHSQKGLEIYEVMIDYPDFTSKETRDCYYCFDEKLVKLSDQPFLSSSEISFFNWEEQQIELSDKGKKKLDSIEIPLQGKAMMLTIDGQPIYGFWFWNVYSSFGCDRVYTYPKLGFQLGFGLPNDNTFGEDPRFDKRIKRHLEKKN